MKIVKREQDSKHLRRLWTNVFGLKVGDRVIVHRTIDTNIEEIRNLGKMEGEIIGIVKRHLSTHHGPYIVRANQSTFRGVMFCKIEELEKIEM